MLLLCDCGLREYYLWDIEKLKEKNVEIISMGDSKLRIVTHLSYTEKMHERFLTILKDLRV